MESCVHLKTEKKEIDPGNPSSLNKVKLIANIMLRQHQMNGNDKTFVRKFLSRRISIQTFYWFCGNSIKFFNFPGILFDIKNGKLKSNKNHTMFNIQKQYNGICDALILNEYWKQSITLSRQ